MQNTEQPPDERRTVRGGSEGAVPTRPQGKQPAPSKLLLIFVLDATLSMEPYIEGVRLALYRMLDVLMEDAYDPSVGLVVFRDEREGEMPEVFPLGTPPAELQATLARVQAIGGGDAPESSLPAIMRALDMIRAGEQNIPRVMLHLTDAGCHDPEYNMTAKSVRDSLMQDGIIYFGCTPNQDPYRAFANGTGGVLFPIQPGMDANAFQGVLLDVARATVKTVRREGTVSPDVLDLVRNTVNRQ